MQSLLAFSHQRWDIVFQRTQHLMTRLARDYRVFFFEPPVFDDKGAWLEISEPAPNVHVCRPHTPQGEPGFADSQIADLQRLLDRLVSSHELGTPIVWLCTSTALPLLQRLEPRCIVYDCSDGFATTADAPREVQLREHAVLKLADLVFTAGRSLFRARQALHDNVHCLPSSVEREHFARARDAGIDHELQRALPHPRFGFFGVVDERLDPVALALLADAHPRLADRARRPDTRRCAATCRSAPTFTISDHSLMPNCRASSPAGMCACCPSWSMRRLAT